MLGEHCRIDGYAMCIKFPLQLNWRWRCILSDLLLQSKFFLKVRFRLNTTCYLTELFLDYCFLDSSILFDVSVHHTQSSWYPWQSRLMPELRWNFVLSCWIQTECPNLWCLVSRVVSKCFQTICSHLWEDSCYSLQWSSKIWQQLVSSSTVSSNSLKTIWCNFWQDNL